MTKMVRVEERVWEKLHALAGRLRTKKKKAISLSDAILHLLEKKESERKNKEKTTEKEKQKKIQEKEHRREIN